MATAPPDIARAEEKFGVTIHQIEGLDLKDDIDGTAALCQALDLVLSAPTAAAHTAASVGAEVWFLSAGLGWPQTGHRRISLVPNTRSSGRKSSATGTRDAALCRRAGGFRGQLAGLEGPSLDRHANSMSKRHCKAYSVSLIRNSPEPGCIPSAFPHRALALATLHAFALFHLNLAFSSIEEEQRATVVRDCYRPLLALAQQRPIGIEATAYTLEAIRRCDPAWLEELAALIRDGKVEFIGSGYAQAIGPLLPADVVAANLRLGNQAYREMLGVTPETRAGQ